MIRRVVANHDGSTTSLLESLTNDVVRVKVLEHRAIRCGKNADALQCSADACAVRRQVELSARERIVLRATAVLVPSRLPHSLMEQLGHTTLAFGALLRCHRVETYREREDYSVDLVKHTLTRTYRIFHREHPVARVREQFLLTNLEGACAAAD